MYFTATREAGDPQVVVVALVNEEIGNTTVMFGTHDLVALPDAGFRLPFVPPGYVLRSLDAHAAQCRDNRAYTRFLDAVLNM